jgi:chaperonin GroES
MNDEKEIKTSIAPLRDRVLVVPLPPEAGGGRTTSKIIAPGPTDDMRRGKVIATGSGHVSVNGDTVALLPMVGQVVLFLKTAGVAFESYGQKFVMLHEAQIEGTEGSNPEPS